VPYHVRVAIDLKIHVVSFLMTHMYYMQIIKIPLIFKKMDPKSSCRPIPICTEIVGRGENVNMLYLFNINNKLYSNFLSKFSFVI
jgi:hypothetical protein